MTRCKKCKEVIGWGFEDIIAGEKETPKRVSKKSRLAGLCEECYKG